MPGTKASAPRSPIAREALEKQFAAALGRRTLDARARDFLDQAFEDYVADEAPEVDGKDLAQLLAASWKHAEKRKHGQPPSIEIHPLHGQPRLTAAQLRYHKIVRRLLLSSGFENGC